MCRERLGEEQDLCFATHRSLEGRGYLGMLSATPTDMGADCFRGSMGSSEKTLCRVPLFACLAPMPPLQFPVARFGNLGDSKGDFGHDLPVAGSRRWTLQGGPSRKLPKDLFQLLGYCRHSHFSPSASTNRQLADAQFNRWQKPFDLMTTTGCLEISRLRWTAWQEGML